MSWFHSQLQAWTSKRWQEVLEQFWQLDFWHEFEQERLS